MKVLFYGQLADLLGHELEVEVPANCSIGQLRDQLFNEHSIAGEALLNKRVRACVAGALVANEFEISATDRVEFLSPVSGG